MVAKFSRPTEALPSTHRRPRSMQEMALQRLFFIFQAYISLPHVERQ